MPEIAAQLSASKFILARDPLYVISILESGSTVICPINAPRLSASFNQGRIISASSAVTDGILRALETAPLSKYSDICSAT